jgi:hypothetical protein
MQARPAEPLIFSVGGSCFSSVFTILQNPTPNPRFVTIGRHDSLWRFINPEAQALFDARQSASFRRVYDDYFFR